MAFTTSATIFSQTTSSTTVAGAPPPLVPFPEDSFSALPRWLLGIALSWIAFGFVLAIVLALAQFPGVFPRLAQTSGLVRQPARGREMTGRREACGRERAMSSAVARPGVEVDGDSDMGGFRLRKPKGLIVHTGDMKGEGNAEGLGTNLAGGDGREDGRRKVKKRVSFDLTTVRTNPPPRSWHAASAPLPDTQTFQSVSESANCHDDGVHQEVPRHTDIETGHALLNRRDLGDRYGERRASPYFNLSSNVMASPEDDVETKGLLGKLNQGVYKVADKLSATLYSQVNGAEEGLLLPVRETEREGWMGKIVD